MTMRTLRETLQYGLIMAVITALLALSGIFASFAGREVIAGGLTLNTVLLAILFGGAGMLTGTRALRRGVNPILPAVIGALMVGVALALLVLLEMTVDLRFVFANLTTPIAPSVTFGQSPAVGVLILLAIGAAVGAAAGALLRVPVRARTALLGALGLTVIVGLLENQLDKIMALSDAVTIALAFALGYLATRRVVHGASRLPLARALIGLVPGALTGLVLMLMVAAGALGEGGLLRGGGTFPAVLGVGQNAALLLPVIFAGIGAVGALAAGGTRTFHNGMIFFMVALLLIGILNTQRAMTPLAAIISAVMFAAALWFLAPNAGERTVRHEALTPKMRSQETTLSLLVILVILFFVPAFTGQYITNVLNGVGLYIVMGIGLNIVVGYAGLLDLGYVAFFAIGAYSVGLLTTPSLLTCNAVAPAEIARAIAAGGTLAQLCPNILSFWVAWPLAIAVSGAAGILLGIPVLRLRGDYLAIVTLGFGEIIRIIIKFDDFKPLLGAAQGIANIPRPVVDLTSINPAWRFELTGEVGIYYLVLATILITGFIGARIVTTRLGRAWLAMRADEDVAQSMGVNLTRTKLLAFAIGAAFAGMGGGLSGVRLYGAYPDSFTILVSINVLSLIIIGGLGSVPGVVIGALMLVGLPEVLRELSDYRLLAFGVLLVAAMILKPDGLIPPPVRRLTERVLARGPVPPVRLEEAKEA